MPLRHFENRVKGSLPQLAHQSGEGSCPMGLQAGATTTLCTHYNSPLRHLSYLPFCIFVLRVHSIHRPL